MTPTTTKLIAAAVGIAAIVASRFVPDAAPLLIGAGAARLGHPCAGPENRKGSAMKTSTALLSLAWIALGCAGCSPSQIESGAADARAAIGQANAKVTKLAQEVEETRAKVEAVKAKALKTAKETIATVTALRAAAILLGFMPPMIEEQTGQALGYANETLGRYERGEQVTKEELLSALDAVASVVRQLRELKREVEPLVDSSLDLVRAAVEGG